MQLSVRITEGEVFHRENRQPSVIGQSSWCSKDKSCLFCSSALKTREKVPFIFRGGDYEVSHGPLIDPVNGRCPVSLYDRSC